jgi:demethylmenaquinone methyltransferase/2-methoxy-6-polyprenyl-1,4-benzoquinol methylase
MSELVKPYHQDQEKKQQVATMFDNIANNYDLLNRVLSLGIDQSWRKKAINQLKDIQPKYILDVATGTGDVALMTMDLLHPDTIIGVDISKQMLEIGKNKIEQKHLSNQIHLELGDSENLRFEDNSFDAVTVAFGVRNFENLDKGLKEIYRVLKPNGRLVVLEFSKPSIFPFKQIYNFYFKYILPTIGRLTSKDNRAYSYLYESVQAFPDNEAFIKKLANQGFINNQKQSLTLGICSIYQGNK